MEIDKDYRLCRRKARDRIQTSDPSSCNRTLYHWATRAERRNSLLQNIHILLQIPSSNLYTYHPSPAILVYHSYTVSCNTSLHLLVAGRGTLIHGFIPWLVSLQSSKGNVTSALCNSVIVTLVHSVIVTLIHSVILSVYHSIIPCCDSIIVWWCDLGQCQCNKAMKRWSNEGFSRWWFVLDNRYCSLKRPVYWPLR